VAGTAEAAGGKRLDRRGVLQGGGRFDERVLPMATAPARCVGSHRRACSGRCGAAFREKTGWADAAKRIEERVDALDAKRLRRVRARIEARAAQAIAP